MDTEGMTLLNSTLRGLTLGLCLSFASAASAQQMVLDFEDRTGFVPLPAGYGGVASWGSWAASDAADPNYPAFSGIVKALSVGPPSPIMFGQDVIFEGAYVVSGLPFSWELSYQGAVVHTSTVLSPNTGGPAVWLPSGYTGPVDSMQYVSSVNIHGVDLFTYTPVGSGPGVPFCDPMDVNSTGMPTTIAADLSAPGGSGLHLEATNGPATEFAYFLVGSGFTEPGLNLSNGRLCLATGGGNSIGRYNVTGTTWNSIGAFDAAGVLQNAAGTSSVGSGFDVPATIPIAGTPTIMVGETWHFQLWHRDTAAGPGQSNFSNGLSVTF